jgi:RNA polymerase sigma factor (sigma-70 family)
MPGSSAGILRQVRKLIKHQPAGSFSDRELLERFSQHRDEAAYGELVRRHGTLVQGVCRRMLNHTQDAEDAFQATFLLLAQKASSLGKRASVANWLFGAARYVSARAKTAARRRRRHEAKAATTEMQETRDDVTWEELKEVLDAELGHLPEHYRTPVLLCYLEGKTQEEAARELGWTPTTVRGRLYRGRDLLKRRLTRRGISFGAGLLVSILSQSSASAAMAMLRKATIEAVLHHTAGKTGTISAEVVALAEEALPMIAAAKTRLVVGFLLALTIIAAAAGLLAHQSVSNSDDDKKPSNASPKSIPEDKKPHLDRFGDPLPANAIARLGTARFRHGGWVHCIAYSPDGKLLASGGEDQVVCIWEAATGKELRRVHADWPARLAFSPNGKMLASSGQQTIHIWDMATGKELRQMSGDQPFGGIAFSPDGKTLASAAWRDAIRLWDATTWKEVRTIGRPQSAVVCVAFSPDGKYLASGDWLDKAVILWEVDSGKEVRRFGEQKDGISKVLFSPDGKNLLAGGQHGQPPGQTDGPIHCWDINTR